LHVFIEEWQKKNKRDVIVRVFEDGKMRRIFIKKAFSSELMVIVGIGCDKIRVQEKCV